MNRETILPADGWIFQRIKKHSSVGSMDTERFTSSKFRPPKFFLYFFDDAQLSVLIWRAFAHRYLRSARGKLSMMVRYGLCTTLQINNEKLLLIPVTCFFIVESDAKKNIFYLFFVFIRTNTSPGEITKPSGSVYTGY